VSSDAWIVFSLAIRGLGSGIILIAAISTASGGTCRIYGDNGYTVEACDNGSFETWDRYGRHRQYGIRNGGFERYPGQPRRPVFERRD
jgi:hypothetical protein